MTQLHSSAHFTSNISPVHIIDTNFSHDVVEQTNNKWMYLIADNINFAEKFSDAIRINKPEENQMFAWMERIIVAGQCSVLFVEMLDLDDPRTLRIKTLCELHNVTLINLTLAMPAADNIVLGPWH